MSAIRDLTKDLIRKWAEDKGIIRGSADSVIAQLDGVCREVQEALEAAEDYYDSVSEYGKESSETKAALHHLMDEIGDIQVYMLNALSCAGVDEDACLRIAYEKISKRKGKTIGGVFVKEEDLQ